MKAQAETRRSCPACGSEQLTVIDSRDWHGARKRRLLCLTCGHRYNTYEIEEDRMHELLELEKRTRILQQPKVVEAITFLLKIDEKEVKNEINQC